MSDDAGLDLGRGVRTSLRTNATAYEYSVFITVSFGVVELPSVTGASAGSSCSSSARRSRSH